MKRKILYGCIFTLFGLMISPLAYAQEEKIALEEPDAVLFYNPETEEKEIVDIDKSLTSVEGFAPIGSPDNRDFADNDEDEDDYTVFADDEDRPRGPRASSSSGKKSKKKRAEPLDADKYQRIVFLEIRAKDGTVSNCSGAMIGPKAVLTAGHCFYPGDKNFSLQEVIVYPGMNYAPLRAFLKTVIFSTVVIKGRNWEKKEMNEEYDWAYIILDEPIGNQTGYFGSKNPTLHHGNKISVMGFPRSLSSMHPWVSTGKVVWSESLDRMGLDWIEDMTADLFSIENGAFDHTAWTEPGSSGAPVFLGNDFDHIIAVSSTVSKDGKYSGASGLGAMVTVVNRARKY